MNERRNISTVVSYYISYISYRKGSGTSQCDASYQIVLTFKFDIAAPTTSAFTYRYRYETKLYSVSAGDKIFRGRNMANWETII